MTAVVDERTFARRWLTYCEERFPLVPSALSATLIALSADLVGQAARSSPAVHIDGASAALAFALFALMYGLRVADEHKDADVDAAVHPDRPVQRGLVSLRELSATGAAAALAALGALWWASPSAMVGFALVLSYAGLMWREFFVGPWLRAHPLVTLVSHQAIVPMMALWAALARGPVALVEGVGIALCALGASWVFEVARKIRAPDDERDGAETYSRPLGLFGAALLCAVGIGLSEAGVVVLSQHLGWPWWSAVVAALGGAVVAAPLFAFARRPEVGGDKKLLGAGALFSLVVHPVLIAAVMTSASAVTLGGGG